MKKKKRKKYIFFPGPSKKWSTLMFFWEAPEKIEKATYIDIRIRIADDPADRKLASFI